MTDLESRYGRPRPLVRVVSLALIAALALSAVGYLGWAVVFQSTPEVQSRMVTFDVTGEHTAEASINVARSQQDTQATCRLVAYADDHSTVGETDVRVDSGPKTQQLVVEIRTDREADSIDLLGCTSPNQERPR